MPRPVLRSEIDCDVVDLDEVKALEAGEIDFAEADAGSDDEGGAKGKQTAMKAGSKGGAKRDSCKNRSHDCNNRTYDCSDGRDNCNHVNTDRYKAQNNTHLAQRPVELMVIVAEHFEAQDLLALRSSYRALDDATHKIFADAFFSKRTHSYSERGLGWNCEGGTAKTGAKRKKTDLVEDDSKEDDSKEDDSKEDDSKEDDSEQRSKKLALPRVVVDLDAITNSNGEDDPRGLNARYRQLEEDIGMTIASPIARAIIAVIEAYRGFGKEKAFDAAEQEIRVAYNRPLIHRG
ncbi:hypothetical protein LTR08_007665 [Meristemomyces frigidus]|nr:hypothetical protein LTR08_007665 [Meristemomyces frigidus]